MGALFYCVVCRWWVLLSLGWGKKPLQEVFIMAPGYLGVPLFILGLREGLFCMGRGSYDRLLFAFGEETLVVYRLSSLSMPLFGIEVLMSFFLFLLPSAFSSFNHGPIYGRHLADFSGVGVNGVDGVPVC